MNCFCPNLAALLLKARACSLSVQPCGWVGGGMGLRVGFINTNDMYKMTAGKGGVYAYEAYEVK